MNSRSKLTALKVPGYRNFLVIPQNNTQTNVVKRKRLGFIPQTKVKQVRVEYYIQDGILIVTFRKHDTNTMFFNQYAAESWFEKKLEVSDLVGQKITRTWTCVHVHKSCVCGYIRHRIKEGNINIPQNLLEDSIIPELEIYGVKCPRKGCKHDLHIEIHEVAEKVSVAK